MKLPHYEKAVVPRAKVTDYLLSSSRPDGRGKARFFRSFGFSVESWEIFAEALLRHVADHDVVRVETSPFGTRYVVEGIISTPDGRAPLIRAVWFVETDEQIPRFATAYPLQREER